MANVLILAFCQAMLMAGASLLISSSALVGRMLAPDPGLATVPLGLQFLATTATTIPASLLMARIGRRAGFALGVGLGVAGAAGCALAVLWGSFWLFCLGAVAVGACNGFGVFYRFAAVEAVPEPLHSRAVSWVLAGGILAAFIGPNLASAGQHWWSTAFLGSFVGLAGLYLLSLLALVPLRLARPVVSRAEGPARPLRVVMSQPLLLVSMFAAMVAYGLMNLVMTATPLAMTDVGMPFAEAAFVIQWHLLGMFVPSFFTGSLIARIGHRPVMTLGGLAIAGCMLVNLGGGGVWQYWAALVLLGLGWNFLFIGATSLLTETYRPAEKARVQGINDFLVFGTVAATALASSALLDGLGWRALNLAGLPVVVLVLLALIWSRRPKAATASAGQASG